MVFEPLADHAHRLRDDWGQASGIDGDHKWGSTAIYPPYQAKGRA